jgi:alpha-glucosidase (family GH31 glycosyl hydrolase)
MRTQANGFTIGDRGRRAQITDPEVLPIWRRYAKLRTQILPYLAAAQREYRRSGLPIMRHLSLLYAGAAAKRDDEFMFGPDLLAAPIVEPGATKRSLRLPRGRWVDLWRAVRYDGSFSLRRARAMPGSRQVTVPAPLAELPLLARAGTILPLLPPDVDTLTGYGKADGLVHLKDRTGAMRLLAFPRGSSRAEIGAGESARSTETTRGWRLRIRGKRTRRYSLEASLSTLKRPFRPGSVTLDGRPVRFTYTRTGTLRASFRTRSGTLAVRR